MDIRIIKDVKQFKFSSEELKQLQPVSYSLKTNSEKGIGLEAQSIDKSLPLLVKQSSSGVTVDYEKLSVALISVVQELAERVEELENKIKRKQK